MIDIMAEKVMADVIKWRRDLHKIPEVGMDLPMTSSYITNVLDEIGVSYKKGVGIEHGIMAAIEGTKAKADKDEKIKTIALRADMDALPIKEETGLEFESKNGNMHACGHDAHIAILLGAAKVLNSIKDQFSGKVVFLFQPGEEISQGAEPMIKAGCLEGVDGIFGIHLGNISPEGNEGMALFKPGPIMASMDKWTMTVNGVGSHGAYPHEGVDPIVISAYIIMGLQEIVSRELDPVDSGVITVGTIKGGVGFNIIPDSVYIEGTARAVKEDTRKYIANRIEEVGRNIAKGFRGHAEVEYTFGPPPVINDERFTYQIMESAKKAMGENNVTLINHPVMGGEDFAFYLREIPGTFAFLKTPLEIDGVFYPHHNSKFAIDEKHLRKGVSVFAQSALDFIAD